MAIRMSAFSGELPKLLPRLLPDNAARVAQNTRMEDGGLQPIRGGLLVHEFPEPVQTIYRHNGEWLGWPGRVKVAPAPITASRLYVTGDGVPKLIVDGITYPLALPTPTAPLTATIISGEPNSDLSQALYWTYTFVTDLGEESQPAPLGNAVLWSPGQTVLLEGFPAAPPPGRRITQMRLYRSQTSALGDTSLYLVAGIDAFNVPVVHDNVEARPIMEPLPSMDYTPPPDDLQGITALPNGMMAGFVGKRLYFSEPYIPHAWPEKYVLTTDFDIVGLGVFGQSIAILTKGQPYVASGASPEAMTMERLRVNLPCVSALGIADLGYAVIYPTHDGLVMINGSGAQLVTEGLFNPDLWIRLGPVDVVAGHCDGRYICNYLIQSERSGMLMLDTRGAQPFVLRASDAADAMFNDTANSVLYVLKGGTRVYHWDFSGAPPVQQVWRSKVHALPGQMNFGCILVEGEDTMSPAERAANKARWTRAALESSVTSFPGMRWLEIDGDAVMTADAPPASFVAAVYADGRLVHFITDLNKPMRLPGGFLAGEWEVEIRTTLNISTVSLAGSPSELAGG